MGDLDKEIEQYCNINALDLIKFKERILRAGFNYEKYGTKPDIFHPKTEVIEKIVEVPVEVIREVPKDDIELANKLIEYENIIKLKDEKIVELQKELEKELEKELQKEKKIKTDSNDFYGDSPIGSYGSNIK